MPCKKCETIPWEKPAGVRDIVIYASHEYLLQKFYENLKHAFSIQRYNECLMLKEDFDDFMQTVSITSSGVFTPLELQNISIMVCKDVNFLKFNDFKSVRTLEQWIHIHQAEELKWILEHNAIVTYFQAIVDVSNREIVGYECLSRGIKRDGSLLYPETMFRLAEKADLLFYLDRLCRIKSLQSARENVITKMIFVNFSPSAIYNPEFCLRSTINTAKELNYDVSKVVFEVIESEKLENHEHLKEVLDYYKKWGFKVALDDVGAGYANLEMLVQLKPDIVKIAMSFVRHVHHEPIKKSVITAITTLAKEMGLKTIAEGVETEEEFSTVKDLGVDYAQGYLFGKPTPTI
ncbi:MAG: EAL domain-containing protein [Atribacterota bacterium]